MLFFPSMATNISFQPVSMSVSMSAFQYNLEQREREMEQEKREELRQLMHKSKNEQSKYNTQYVFLLNVLWLVGLLGSTEHRSVGYTLHI